jgi:diadenylate cyclase
MADNASIISPQQASSRVWWIAGLATLVFLLFFMNQVIIRIGFLPIVVKDLLDIAMVTLLVYKLYTIMRGTRAAQMTVGLFLILVIVFFNGIVKMSGVSWIVENVKTVWLIGFVILFQPELRRSLILLGQSRIVRFFVPIQATEIMEEVAKAAEDIARKRYGGLFVLVRDTGLKAISETGVRVQAGVTSELIVSIFMPRSPLHDGALIINGALIESARAILPLSQNPKYQSLGTRHQAAIGLSEESDAVVVVISEETGQISVAENGELRRGLEPATLADVLARIYEERPAAKAS